MKNIALLLNLILISLSFSTSAFASEGMVKRYLFNVGQFDKIEIDDNINVIYRCVADSTGYVSYTGSEEFSNTFILTNNKGSLRIQINTEDVGNPHLPVLHVYSDFLTSVVNSSSATLRIESPAPAACFTARQVGNGKILAENLKATTVKGIIVTGNGTVNLTGVCENAEFKMIGTGKIMADRLQSQNCKCFIVGGGEIGCWALENLRIKGIGSTKIYYKGDPKIKKSGGGKIMALPSASSPDSPQK